MWIWILWPKNQTKTYCQHKRACNCVDILKHFTKCGIDCTSLSDFLPFHIYCNRSTTARLVCHSGELRRQPKWSRLKCSRLTWQRLNRDKRRFEILANFDSLRQDAHCATFTLGPFNLWSTEDLIDSSQLFISGQNVKAQLRISLDLVHLDNKILFEEVRNIWPVRLFS